MSPARIAIRSVLLVTFLISIGVIGYALYYSAPKSEGAWAAIAAALAVMASVIATWIALRTLELQQDAQQPYVFPQVDATSRYSFLQLRVKNSGGSPAYDINLIWDRPLINSRGETVKFTTQEGAPELPVLLPGESMSILIDEGSHFFQAVQDANYTGRVIFKNASGKQLEQVFHLSIEPYRSRLQYDQEEPRTNYMLQQIPQKLDRITRELSSIREVMLRDENDDDDHD